MKRYIKSTGYKSGDRYYGGLPAEPSIEEYGRAIDDARNSFNKFMSDNNVTVTDLKQGSGGATYQSYRWATPDNREIEIVYYNRGLLGGSTISECYIEDASGYHKVNVYDSKYKWYSLREAYLPDIISAFNSDSDELSLVFYE